MSRADERLTKALVVYKLACDQFEEATRLHVEAGVDVVQDAWLHMRTMEASMLVADSRLRIAMGVYDDQVDFRPAVYLLNLTMFDLNDNTLLDRYPTLCCLHHCSPQVVHTGCFHKSSVFALLVLRKMSVRHFIVPDDDATVQALYVNTHVWSVRREADQETVS